MWKTRQKKKRFFFIFIRAIFLLAVTAFLVLIFIWKQNLLPDSKFISPLAGTFDKDNNTPNDFVKKIEAALSKNNVKFSSVSVASDSSYLVHMSDTETVVFTSNKSLDEQISSLQLMLSRFTIEGKRIERLDLRFDNPIAIFKN